MNAVFADTWFYLALLNKDDAEHGAATRLSEANTGIVVVTEFVLLELANALCQRGVRAKFLALLASLRADPGCEVIPISRDLFGRGLDLFAQRQDKDWSLTDCMSFVVMRERGIRDALTADRHFEQAGFNVLFE